MHLTLSFDGLAILTLGIALSALSLTMMIHYLPKLRKVASEQRQAGEIVGMIVSELRQRLAQQDQRIMDHEVRLDVVQLRLPKPSEQNEAGPQARRAETSEIVQEIRSIMSKAAPVSSGAVMQRDVPSMGVPFGADSVLSGSQRRIIEFLGEGPKRPREVQVAIGRSREHTARLLNELFQQGYVVRDDIKRPFVYQLSPKGQKLLR